MGAWIAGGRQREVQLPPRDDEEMRQNEKFIQDYIGADVKITRDLPPIHSTCGLEIGDCEHLKEIDGAMQVAMMNAMKKTRETQQAQGGFISFSQLQKYFESNMEYHKLDKEDIRREDHLIKDSGVTWAVGGAPDRDWMLEAERVMRRTVQVPGVDADMWERLQIDTAKITEIFGDRGVGVCDFPDVFVASNAFGHIAIDIGCVRFPRVTDPVFKVYRFRVIVFKSETRVTFLGTRGSGIFTQFRQSTYQMTPLWNEKFEGASKEKIHAKFKDTVKDLGLDDIWG